MAQRYRYTLRDQGTSMFGPPQYGTLMYHDSVSGTLARRVAEFLSALNVPDYDGRWIHNSIPWDYIQERILHTIDRRLRERYEARSEDMAWLMRHVGPATATYFSNPIRDDSFDAALFIKKDKTMQNNYDPQTGAPLPKPYESRIKGGDELKVGVRYRLEVVGGKNPPDIAKPGNAFIALGDAEGNFTGEVVDPNSYRVFATDASDLYIAA